MKKGWMIRASKGSVLFDEFEKKSVVAMGWSILGDLSAYENKELLQEAYIKEYGNDKPAKTANAVAMLWKFAHEIQKGDMLISYSNKRREYIVGKDLGKYCYASNVVPKYSNIRRMEILGYVSRDSLQASSRQSLNAVLTVFSLNESVVSDFLSQLKSNK